MLKAAILANHAHIFEKVIKPEDITLVRYKKGLSCSVYVDKESIRAGYIPSSITLPSDVNNVLYVNGIKLVEGPGAGARVTAEMMYRDYLELLPFTIS